jgi:hypothetical protein
MCSRCTRVLRYQPLQSPHPLRYLQQMENEREKGPQGQSASFRPVVVLESSLEGIANVSCANRVTSGRKQSPLGSQYIYPPSTSIFFAFSFLALISVTLFC